MEGLENEVLQDSVLFLILWNIAFNETLQLQFPSKMKLRPVAQMQWLGNPLATGALTRLYKFTCLCQTAH